MPSRSLPSLVLGFFAGALAVLFFHQAMLGVLHSVRLVSAMPYNLQPTWPLRVPLVWSLAFWGGLWGIALVWVGARLGNSSPLLFGLLFGAILPTLVAWFIVAPLKGLEMAAGWEPARMVVGPLVNGAWGIGTIVFLRGFSRLPVLRRIR